MHTSLENQKNFIACTMPLLYFAQFFFCLFSFWIPEHFKTKRSKQPIIHWNLYSIVPKYSMSLFLVIHFLCKKKTVKQNMFLISAHVFLFSWLRKEIKRRNYFLLSSILVLFDSSPCIILLTFPLWSYVWILLTFGDAKSVRLTISSPVSVRVWDDGGHNEIKENKNKQSKTTQHRDKQNKQFFYHTSA